MRIKIAEKAGFCMGVRRAVNLVLRAVNQGLSPIYTYGPLIHNPQTLELLSKLGVQVIKTPEEGQAGGVCVIRAHGIPPQEKKVLEEKFKLLDGTCPRVLKVQALADRAVKEGKSVIIIGDKDHAEVKGILGYCQGKGYVVSSLKDLEALPQGTPFVVLSQTTQDEEVFELLAEEIKSRFKDVEIINTICNATEVRQAGVRKLCETCEAIVVVGGKFSANTKRLAQIAESQGKKVYFVERPEELPLEEIKKVGSLGITAGASTPNWLINSVVDLLKRHTSKTYALLRSLAISQAYAGLFIPILLLALLLIKGIPFSFSEITFLLFSLFFSTALIFLVNFINRDTFPFFYPERANFYRSRSSWLYLAGLFVLSIIFGLLYKPRILSLVIIFTLLSFLFKQSPLQGGIDILFYIALLLYLYPLWDNQFFLLSSYALLILLFVKFYLEMVYLQTDGLLPRSFLLALFDFDDRRIKKLLKIILIGLLIFPFSLSYFSLANLLFLIPTLSCLLLYQTLLKRKLGQVVYLELLSLIPFASFLLVSIILRIW